MFLAMCPIILGLLKSKTLKQSHLEIEKIIELINRIIAEIKYKKTDTYLMFLNLSLEDGFKNLNFLSYFKNPSTKIPFPTAWNQSIESWETPIPKRYKNILKSLSNILGSGDSTEQILALKHKKILFEEGLKHTKNIYISKGKLARCFGTTIGILVFILLI